MVEPDDRGRPRAADGACGGDLQSRLRARMRARRRRRCCSMRCSNEGRDLTAIATDDAHFRYDDACGGWVMVKAEANEPGALLAALKAGHFYSSQGPLIHAAEISGGVLHVECSPVGERRGCRPRLARPSCPPPADDARRNSRSTASPATGSASSSPTPPAAPPGAIPSDLPAAG